MALRQPSLLSLAEEQPLVSGCDLQRAAAQAVGRVVLPPREVRQQISPHAVLHRRCRRSVALKSRWSTYPRLRPHESVDYILHVILTKRILHAICISVHRGAGGKSAMSAKTFIAAFAIIVAINAPQGAVAGPSGHGATIKYQTYGSINEVVFRVAEEKFCAKYDLKCEGVLIPSGPMGIQALMGDSIQIAFVAADAQIRAIANGASVKMISGFIDRVPYYVVVRSDLSRPNKGAGFPSIMKDLKEKKIGVTGRGAGVELTFDLLLRAAGMASSDVTYVAVGGPATAFGSLKSKQIDAAILFQPMPGLCETSGVCETIIDLTRDEGGSSVSALDGASSTVLAKNEFIEKNPDVVKAFVAAFQDSAVWIKDPKNFDELQTIAKKYVKLNVPQADIVLDDGLKEQVGNTDTSIKIDAVRAYIDVLYEHGLINRKLDPKEIIWSGASVR
nr:C553 [uncultured bacterium]